MINLYLEQLWTQFHFIRPLWLLAYFPLVILIVLRWRRSTKSNWNHIIPKHLQQALIIGEQGWKSQLPLKLLMLILSLAILVCAGPTWQREASPFGEDKGALIIVLDVSQSMQQTDVAPTRLERAKFKIRDLLQQRKGGKTALVVYAGSAHIAMPLTEDNQVFLPLLDAISPKVMPAEGKAAQTALPQIKALSESLPTASILVVSDGVSDLAIQQYGDYFGNNNQLLMVLGVGNQNASSASAPDWASLQDLASNSDGYFYALSLDDGDTANIIDAVERHTQIEGESTMPWKDMGYYLLFPMVLLALVWFRKGWLVQWLWLASLSLPMTYAPDVYAQQSQSDTLVASQATSQDHTPKTTINFFDRAKQHWLDLWMTPEQQGQWYFNRGDYLKAANHYQDPLRKGIAFYYAREFTLAQAQFVQLNDNQTARLYLGNALARQREYLAAKRLFDDLRQNATSDEIKRKAEQNFKAMSELVDEINRLSASQAGSTDGPEESTELGDKPRTGEGADEKTTQQMMLKETLNAQEILGSQELADKWLRKVEADPQKFLRAKFQLQLNQQLEGKQ
ncbi:VWA domain-containing protein [Vibrio hippocampi]|uniref:VWFA domain-containing protein n=1 Tax=Vibrio hippocampi TaxID=654686 RepID=A0ABN8DMI6_9VIBR|nr:VWA domain-containing protein [Vibrio hippocampi]CAH0529651.1 hypothetical protein VHP8226_03406 [Vibrio hippocampi]